MDAPEALWSPQQQAWLAAMGLTVYNDAAQMAWPPVAAPAPALSFENVPAPTRAPPTPRQPAAEALPAPLPGAQASAVADAALSAPRRRGGSGLLASLPDRLMLALLRASALNPNDEKARAVMQGWELDRLRADPAAKRALWPQLRALRKQRQGR